MSALVKKMLGGPVTRDEKTKGSLFGIGHLYKEPETSKRKKGPLGGPI